LKERRNEGRKKEGMKEGEKMEIRKEVLFHTSGGMYHRWYDVCGVVFWWGAECRQEDGLLFICGVCWLCDLI